MSKSSKWLLIGGTVVVGVSLMTFVTTNPFELLLVGIMLGLIAWQGAKIRGGSK